MDKSLMKRLYYERRDATAMDNLNREDEQSGDGELYWRKLRDR